MRIDEIRARLSPVDSRPFRNGLRAPEVDTLFSPFEVVRLPKRGDGRRVAGE